MKPGWLVAIGLVGNLIFQVFRDFFHHGKGLGLAAFSLVVVSELLVYAMFAPAERAEAAERSRGAG
jgi:hypothetical protein